MAFGILQAENPMAMNPTGNSKFVRNEPPRSQQKSLQIKTPWRLGKVSQMIPVEQRPSNKKCRQNLGSV